MNKHKQYNIKVDLKDISYDSMEWVQLAQDMDQWQTLLKLLGSTKSRDFLDYLANCFPKVDSASYN